MNKFTLALKNEFNKLLSVCKSNVPAKDKILPILMNKISMVVIAFMIIVLFSSGSSDNNSVSNNNVTTNTKKTISGTGPLISMVKKGTLVFDSTTTVGNALDNYQFFKTIKWSEFEDQQKRKVVEFVGIVDMPKSIDYVLNEKYDASTVSQLPIHKEILLDTQVKIQFLINTDNESFKLANAAIETEGDRFLKVDELLTQLYKNKPLYRIYDKVNSAYSSDVSQIFTKINSEKLEAAKKQFFAQYRKQFIGKYIDLVRGEDGKCQLAVEDINESSVKIMLTMKDSNEQATTYNLNIPINLRVDSPQPLLNNQYDIRGDIISDAIPNSANSYISIFKEGGGPIIYIHGLCSARFSKD
ncbi:hypothetical protein [Desulfovibrio sp. TomC]|uniref:hypothetical protein n=1 Tax=Desulfovibrio sp. TomC TaxID=1562888 RepID=UPI000574D956|nr:hypothetical protein [Desulfovibrio sp. TomC]KHK02899.1 hypothetical protein NY78_1849 [Desulfovibrio sp. TomC]